MKKILSFIAISLLSLSAQAAYITSDTDAALAGATVENFNSIATGDYASLSVAGATIVGIGAPMSIDSVWTSQYGKDGQSLNNKSSIPKSFDIIFDNTVSAFGIWGGAYDNAWTFDAYDILGNLIESVSSNLDCCLSQFASLANAGMKSITLSGYGDWVIFDDLTFVEETSQVSQVPVPAAAWLFGSALLGFFGFSRKKATVA